MRGSVILAGVAAFTTAIAVAAGVGARPYSQPAMSVAFTDGELETLAAGAVVPRPLRFRHRGGQYVGGVSYQVVNAPSAVVYASLASLGHLHEVLPNTFAARRVHGADAVTRVELTQGNQLVRATYTICVVPDPVRSELRFWLDPEHPHDIEDAWGYFRAQDFGDGRSLITVAAALDLGAGLARLFFEDAVQAIALAMPHHISAYVEPRFLAMRRRGVSLGP